jgi:hypothetical protein
MTIYIYQSSAKTDMERFGDFMEKLGITVVNKEWKNAHWPLKEHTTDTLVDTERQSPYIFGKRLREAALCPESKGWPYAAVNETNGIQWVHGDNGRFSWKKANYINLPEFTDLVAASVPHES